ncbi:MAG: CinA family protein [Steroidobacteraceae bacterium]|nr:CinA family protein [Steroidobacteraceae bacterium]
MIADVAGRLRATGRELVTAESCTGGWIAKACTDLPGSSRWFRGGAVVYGNELKTSLLGVRPDTLSRHGAVSEAVVREMAVGALERLGGDVAVAVSGIAGPDGGMPDKPVGTVWFAWATRIHGAIDVRVACEHFAGERATVRQLAVDRAIAGLLAA